MAPSSIAYGYGISPFSMLELNLTGFPATSSNTLSKEPHRHRIEPAFSRHVHGRESCMVSLHPRTPVTQRLGRPLFLLGLFRVLLGRPGRRR